MMASADLGSTPTPPEHRARVSFEAAFPTTQTADSKPIAAASDLVDVGRSAR